MLQDTSSRKISSPIVGAAGVDTVLVAGTSDKWIYIHEIQGDLDVVGTVSLLSGTDILGTWALDAGQGLTTEDIPGEDNRPRFECKPGEDFIIRVSAGSVFTGAMAHSFRY